MAYIVEFECSQCKRGTHQTIADGGLTPFICLDCIQCNSEIYDFQDRNSPDKQLRDKLDGILNHLQSIESILRNL